jgi:hypothetical protein
MKKRSIVIQINQLPLRYKGLSLEDTQNLFGGCGQTDATCFTVKDCCEPAICEIPSGTVIGKCKPNIIVPY